MRIVLKSACFSRQTLKTNYTNPADSKVNGQSGGLQIQVRKHNFFAWDSAINFVIYQRLSVVKG